VVPSIVDRGSQHAIEIERKYKREMPELSLSDAIGQESPYKPRGVGWLIALLVVRHDKFTSEGMPHSDGKIELFYKSVLLILLITTVFLALFGGVKLELRNGRLYLRGACTQSVSPS